MPLTYKDIAEIIKIIDASDCEELVVELDGARLEVRRHGSGGKARAAYSDGAAKAEGNAAAFDSGAAADAPEAAQDAVPASRPQADAGATAEGKIAVRAPMVGTFYRAAGPQEPPFVEAGDKVAPGDALCLIEVMKLYTTIEAEVAGRIVEIAAEDTALVEHDQVLFVIEPG